MQVINHEIIYGAAFAAVGVVGGAYDFRTRLIPNWLTFPAIAVALIAHGVLDGVSGLISSALAGAVVLAILALVIAMRGMGMGDLKLMLAVCMFAGMQKCLWIIFFTVIINGVLSLAYALRKRYFKRAAQNTLVILRHVVKRPFTPHPELNLDNENVYRLPFGVAVGLGCIVTVVYSGVVGL